MFLPSGIALPRLKMFAMLLIPGFSVAQPVEYFDYTLFVANSQSLTIEDFDSFAAQTLLSGDEFAGLEIDSRRITVVDPQDFAPGLSVGGANVNSQPNGISASLFYTGSAIQFDNGDDNFLIKLDTPSTVAGLWLGNLGASNNDPNTETTVAFFDSTGALLASESLTQASVGLIGSGANNRIFYGISSTTPISSFTVENAASDSDGIVLDDIQFGSLMALCNGLPITVDLNQGQTPGPGDDVILGTSGSDFIDAGAGDDTICGMGGADMILAGGGADYVEGGNGADRIFGEGGNDIIFAGPGADEIDGGGGDDEIFGEAGNDVLDGRTGEDILDGGSGVDSISGGPQADVIFAGSGATVGTGSFVSGGGAGDTIFGGPDADDLRGAAGADTIHGGGDNDVITGGIGQDELFGGSGDDTIRGQGSRDDLFGEAGDDDLTGGAGVDDLDGGSGLDSCAGQAGTGDTAVNCESESTIP